MAITARYAPLWASTIGDVRAAAPSLELSYAALYAVEYPNVTFWSLVDVMGVDAYFPLATASNPTPPLADVVAAWDTNLEAVQVCIGAGCLGLPHSSLRPVCVDSNANGR